MLIFWLIPILQSAKAYRVDYSFLLLTLCYSLNPPSPQAGHGSVPYFLKSYHHDPERLNYLMSLNPPSSGMRKPVSPPHLSFFLPSASGAMLKTV